MRAYWSNCSPIASENANDLEMSIPWHDYQEQQQQQQQQQSGASQSLENELCALQWNDSEHQDPSAGRAEPSNVVATGNQVAFFCEVPVVAKEYRLYNEGSQDYLTPTTILETENKAIFSISSVQWYNAGQYWCGYTSSHGPSEHSDTLELVVTGVYSRKVTLSTLASPLVTSGQNVTLQCVSQQAYNRFILLKEDQMFSSAVSSPNINHGLSGARFRVGPVTPDQRWRLTCYGYYLNNHQVWSVSSNDIQLLVSGSSVTIWCGGPLQALTYVIHKEGSPEARHIETQVDHNNKAKVSIPSVSSLNAGRYNCFSYSSDGWTEHSDIVELVVTGVHDGKPTLSALPSPVVTSVGNVTLQYSEPQDHTVENLIRMGLSGLILTVLAILLFYDCR
ncbi:leukocyte immunoglobulin-like receptor subfamily B member 3-like, partial [Cricetulus griseus]|uniref:leukocyte immunoglobulin-like receptor subfamily B member 3-like n=1 Tax=Cricetulus griseus TaxID=10029 RepID=UPI0007DA6E3E